MATKHHCKIHFNARYHSRASPTKRTYHTLMTMLAMYVNDIHKKWDTNLHYGACAFRTAKHETTHLSPYFVNFGRNMMLSDSDCDDPINDMSVGETDLMDRSGNKLFREVNNDV